MQQLIRSKSFVPKHEPLQYSDVKKLINFIQKSSKLVVLTGAGISTESGIPDYRSPETGVYSQKRKIPFKPILQSEFIESKILRQRYWLKNYIGWPSFSSRIPNITHISLSKLEKAGKIEWIITQNVDNLHFKGGSKNVIELHGTAYCVKCLSCDFKILREDFQNILKELNPNIVINSFGLNPDGDVDIDEVSLNIFKVPDCPVCSDLLQPDIVFFGGNVPKERTSQVRGIINNCDSLLILGSTLTVFSSYRIVLQAFENKIPILIVNIGNTRADNLANMKIEARCSEILSLAYNELIGETCVHFKEQNIETDL